MTKSFVAREKICRDKKFCHEKKFCHDEKFCHEKKFFSCDITFCVAKKELVMAKI